LLVSTNFGSSLQSGKTIKIAAMRKLFVKKIIFPGLFGLIMAIFIIGLALLNWLFEEDGYELVQSISAHTESQSVLAVFAHPDDEQLVTGLLLKAAQSANTHTAVITATQGEAGTPLPQISRKKDLGIVRKAETLKNTWALGVDKHRVLNFPDGGLIDIPLDELVETIKAAMIEYRADLIVTFWPTSGFSNHEDHKRIGLAAEIAAVELRSSTNQGYQGPDHIAYTLAPTRMMNRFAGDVGKTVVANQPRANYAQDGEAWTKIRGWKIHASQRDYVMHAYGLPPWLIHRLYDKEFYYLIKAEDIPGR